MIQGLREAFTVNGEVPEIAGADGVVNGEIFAENTGYSLARELFGNLPLYAPTGQLINVKREPDGLNKFKLKMVSTNVKCFDIDPINIGFTVEAYQDLVNTWGLENSEKFLSSLIDGVVVDEHNNKAIPFLDTNSNLLPAITVPNSVDPTEVAYAILAEIAKHVHQANRGKFRTYGHFVILPASLSHLFDILTIHKQSAAKIRKGGNVLFDDGTVVIARNPYSDADKQVDKTSDNNVYFGLLDRNEPSRSGAVFSQYKRDVVMATDNHDGSSQMFLYNRFALTANPLHHKTTNPMLWKVAVNVV